MIDVKTGNLLESNTQTLVNTVNCVGIMGKGIALEFKKQYPEMFKDYAARCSRGEVKLGKPYLYRGLFTPWILNFPTKDHWRSLAKLDAIVEGLEFLEANYQEWGITSIAVPPLGCGNGQLEWKVVGPTLYRHLARFAIPVELYAPAGTPIEELQLSFLGEQEVGQKSSKVTTSHTRINPSWIGLAEIVKRLDSQPFHWPIGRTVFQKIAYVATSLGLPTGLEFERASYGPFAPGVKRVEARLLDHGLLNEEWTGQMQRISVGRTFEDAQIAYADELCEWGEILDRTVDLFMRISTARQAELVTTVMFAANQLSEENGTPSEEEIFDEVSRWKIRRNPPIQPADIKDMIRGLTAQGWITATPVGSTSE